MDLAERQTMNKYFDIHQRYSYNTIERYRL